MAQLDNVRENKMSLYFNYDERMDKFFKSHRGYLMSITVDKKSGEERVLTGILCLSAKGVPLISEGDSPEEPDLKQIAVTRIKSIFMNGINYRPKG